MNNIEHQVGDYLMMGSTMDSKIKTLYIVIDITKDNKIVVQECTKIGDDRYVSNSSGAVYLLKWNKDLNS